ncbi:MAG: metallophosphoesterase [Saprospiraceae bacterium]|nr:metallophosphoesterase [Saprospiraceae bacterium]
MRTLFFVSILLALDIYGFQAFRYLVQNWSVTVRNIMYGVYWAIPVLAIGTMIVVNTVDVSDWNTNFKTYWRTFIFIAYISKLPLVSVLLIDDLRRGVLWIVNQFSGGGSIDLSRSKFLTRTAVVLGALPFTSLLYGMIRNPYRYKRYEETLKLSKLPASLNGLKIIQISDIHSGSFTFKEPIKQAIDMINAEKPDLVFFTGDLVNNVATEMEPYVDIFDKIEAKYGVYSVLGNHDYGDYERWPTPEAKVENLERLKNTHKRLGWDLLLNEHRHIEINGERVAVIGVENYSMQLRFPKYGDLEKACENCGPAALKLLLSHDPSHWEGQVIKDQPDIDITFSGHTHGMQFGVEIPGWVRWSPIQYVYKQWAGLYQRGEQYLYVNRGLGFLGYPGRVGILPEIAVLELKSA